MSTFIGIHLLGLAGKPSATTDQLMARTTWATLQLVLSLAQTRRMAPISAGHSKMNKPLASTRLLRTHADRLLVIGASAGGTDPTAMETPLPFRDSVRTERLAT